MTDVPYLRLQPAERLLVRLYRRTGGLGVVVLLSAVSILISVLATYLLVVPLLTPVDVANGMLTVSLVIAVAVPLIVAPAATRVMVGLLVRLDDAYRKVLTLSTIDPLTTVANRRGLFAAADVRLRERDAAHVAVVGMVDVSDFKGINDAHGHTAGDEVLIELARRLQAIVMGAGVVGRIGGDEFALVIAGSPADTHRVMDDVRTQCRTFVVASGRVDIRIPVEASIGMVTLEPGETFAHGLMRADAAMYGR
jgi:diguanylate cyclase (GGDEF)-like protein